LEAEPQALLDLVVMHAGFATDAGEPVLMIARGSKETRPSSLTTTAALVSKCSEVPEVLR